MMGKRKRTAKRTHKVIGFKAFHDSDADILDWWEGIEEGERSAMIRDILRDYLGGHRAKGTPLSKPADAELHHLVDETAWIRTALTDLPGYVERVIQHVAAMQVMNAPSPTSTPVVELSKTDVNRREEKLRQTRW